MRYITRLTAYLFAVILLHLPTAVMAAGAPESGSAASVRDNDDSKMLIDFTDPAEVLNPDKYVELFNLAQSWLITHGPNFVAAILILFCGRWIAKRLTLIGRRAMEKGNVDPTLARFLGKIIYYAMLMVVLIAAADQLGIKTTSFLALFGAAGLAIGLALKDSLGNFASGIMLIIFRPFKVGDYVYAGGVSGQVEQIDIFSTILLTPDNQQYIIPNSMITSDVITNVNALPTRRVDLLVGIGYEDDLLLAKNTLEKIIGTEPRVLSKPDPVIAVSDLGESSVNMVFRFWVKTEDYWSVRFAVTEQIKTEFDQQGISFPFPQRDIHLYHKTD